jgi:apolipoprotein N-acyltransferase
MQDLHFNQLGYEAAKAQGDLIVFPETSFTFHWIRCTPEQVAELPYYLKECYPYNRRFAEVKARDWRTPILLGVNSIIYSSERQSHVNSAILIGTDAVELGHYDKCCRVPFGEYLPFRETIPAMKYLSPYDFDYGIDPGQSLTIFELPKSGLRFGVLICYEDTVPHLARKFMQEQFDGRPLDFFINISNDGWFRGSEEHEQHLATARFRAVECRRSLARAVNMGISAIIDGNGRILALPADTWGQSKAIEGIVAATIPIDRRHSLYVLWGDVLPWACLLVLLGGIAWVPLSRARSVSE